MEFCQLLLFEVGAVHGIFDLLLSKANNFNSKNKTSESIRIVDSSITMKGNDCIHFELFSNSKWTYFSISMFFELYIKAIDHNYVSYYCYYRSNIFRSNYHLVEGSIKYDL